MSNRRFRLLERKRIARMVRKSGQDETEQMASIREQPRVHREQEGVTGE